VFGTLHFGGSPVGELVLETRFSRIPREPPPSTFNYARDIAAFAPGTGTPVAGGLSSAQALAIVRGLGAVNLVGADVVEVAPAYDHADITAIAAAHVACDLLCLWRQKKVAAR
ncbi:arginase family protein, partial [Burkholderia cenocepacia]|uniref:arginase family protein n=1 Tax=Burkholderia cenocepacia TaxID=95486 RepID=UPI0020133019